LLIGVAGGCRPQPVDRSGGDGGPDGRRAAARDSAVADSRRVDARIDAFPVVARVDAGVR
jgi:hypothetical protein